MYKIELFLMRVPDPVYEVHSAASEVEALDLVDKYYGDPSILGYRITAPDGTVLKKMGVMR